MKIADRLTHLIDIASLDAGLVEQLFATADHLREQRSLPKPVQDRLCRIHAVNMFYENSTRTQLGFEYAARQLGLHISNLQSEQSSSAKGESLTDTFHTLAAMGYRLFNVRHPQVGSAQQLAAVAPPGVHIINAGDGVHAHPTQALADAYTMRDHFGQVAGLKVVIAGDLRHSRVARSNIALLGLLDAAEIRLVAPPEMDLQPIPNHAAVRCYQRLDDALPGADVVMMLRIQMERMDALEIPDRETYLKQWGLTPARLRLAGADVRIMHPGPLNRGLEIDTGLADGQQSLILRQVELGVYLRMAVMLTMLAPDATEATTDC
jgi:aspartate carbamoyltransferase catalytic subunit